MQIENLYTIYLQHPSIQTDTRKIKKDDLFFALKGENFNGNKFAAESLTKGAAYAIVDEEQYVTSKKILLVDDVSTDVADRLYVVDGVLATAGDCPGTYRHLDCLHFFVVGFGFQHSREQQYAQLFMDIIIFMRIPIFKHSFLNLE